MTKPTNRSGASDDPLAVLAGANPVPADGVARTSDHEAAKAALFQEITMSTQRTADPTTDPTSADPTSAGDTGHTESGTAALLPHPVHRSRLWALPLAAAAAVVVVVSAAVVLVPRGESNAAAALTEAAQETTDAASGRVAVEATQVGGDEAGTLTMITSYSGDDLETVISFDDPAGDADLAPGRLRLVDGVVYSAFADPEAPAGTEPQWYIDEATDAQSALRELALPADPTIASKGLVELIRAADGVERTGDGHYRATVTIGQLRALEVVPAGLDFLIVDPPVGGAIPDDEAIVIAIDVDAEGRLSRLVGSIDDATVGTETVPVDVTVTTTFSDLGQVGPITAPAGAIPTPPIEMSPEQEKALAVLQDLDARRPSLCADQITTDDTAYTDCLRAAGEPEAAAAFESMLKSVPSDATDTGGGNGN